MAPEASKLTYRYTLLLRFKWSLLSLSSMCSAGGKMGGSGIDCEGVGYGGVGFGSEKGLNSRALDIGSLKGTYGGGGRGKSLSLMHEQSFLTLHNSNSK